MHCIASTPPATNIAEDGRIRFLVHFMLFLPMQTLLTNQVLVAFACLVATLPLVTIYFVAWSLGEVTGYLAGAGDSCQATD